MVRKLFTPCNVGARGPLPNPIIDYVLMLYRRGEIATLDEGAWICVHSRQRMRAILIAARIDWRETRKMWVAQHRRRAVRIKEGRKPKRPSKVQLRAIGKKAAQNWRRQIKR